jgi:hypothetical protein
MKRLASRSTWWHICPTRVNAVYAAERRGQPWTISARALLRTNRRPSGRGDEATKMVVPASDDARLGSRRVQA